MPLQVFTLRERPELRAAVFSADFQPPFWPEYLLHDAAALEERVQAFHDLWILFTKLAFKNRDRT